jgi:hypothetical protein
MEGIFRIVIEAIANPFDHSHLRYIQACKAEASRAFGTADKLI